MESNNNSEVLATSEGLSFESNLVENLTLEDSEKVSERLQQVVSKDDQNAEKSSQEAQNTTKAEHNLNQASTQNKGSGSSFSETDLEAPCDNTEHKENQRHSSVSFDIPIGSAKPRRQPPKRLCNLGRTRKELSAEVLKEKQKLADERRKKQEDERLERIHQRQEAARRLAHNVDILLQQKALTQGEGSNQVQRMSHREILSTANQVAHNFYLLKCQLGKDLKVDDRVNIKTTSHVPRNQSKRSHGIDKNQNMRTPSEGSRKNSETGRPSGKGVSFVVNLGEDKNENKSATPKHISSPKRTSNMTQFDLVEKQRKAEERRELRKQERIRRTRENRESLMKMKEKMDKLVKHEAAASGYSDYQDQKLAKEEVVQLAHEVAEGFDRLAQRYQTDLSRAENFFVHQPQGFLGQ